MAACNQDGDALCCIKARNADVLLEELKQAHSIINQLAGYFSASVIHKALRIDERAAVIAEASKQCQLP